MFLKFLDDLELQREDEASSPGRNYESMLREMRDAAGIPASSTRAPLSASWRKSSPPGQRHRRISRRDVQSFIETGQNGRRPKDPAENEPVRV